MKQFFIKALPFIIVVVVLFMLGSLKMGWLHPFFFDMEHATVQGTDYFSLPKAYLNLLEKRSAYDTWGGAFFGVPDTGVTWYLSHPAFAVFVGSWFSFFSPWVSYALFVVFSLGLVTLAAWFISRETPDPFKKRLSFLFMLCAFPTYWMLFVGNPHAPLVLALALIFIALLRFATAGDDEPQLKRARYILMTGLLISLFSKPIVLLMLPVLLLTRETRKTTVVSLFVYGIVSFLFVVVPAFNPQGVGIGKLLELDPQYVKDNLNIYKNNFVLNAYMKDNAMHWLNLIAQSDHKLMHIDVFSLPVFVDTMFGREIAPTLFKLPIYLCMLLSIGVVFIKDSRIRLESTLLLVMAISLTFFLSYNTVWEYQFTSVLPIVALLPIIRERGVFYNKYVPLMLGLAVCFCLPSLYFLVREGTLNTAMDLNIIRFDRVVPALLLFLVMITFVVRSVIEEARIELPEAETEGEAV